MKWKRRQSVGYWTNCVTFPFDHTHDLDVEFSRKALQIALFLQWKGWLTWNKSNVSGSFMTMLLLGWLAVPDNDQGDFWCQSANHTYSFSFSQGQFWPAGIVVACICPSVRQSIRQSVHPSVTKFVRTITHYPFKLGSPNLDHRCIRPWLRSLLFWGLIDLELQGLTSK